MSLSKEPPRALIVEDHQSIIDEYMIRCSLANVPFVVARTLEDAMGAFRGYRLSIEVVVLDGVFPLNATSARGALNAGRDFARWLRDQRFEGTVIAASSDPSASDDILAALGRQRCSAAEKGTPAAEAAIAVLKPSGR